MEKQEIYEHPQPTRIEILAAQTIQYYELLCKRMPESDAAAITAAAAWRSLKDD